MNMTLGGRIITKTLEYTPGPLRAKIAEPMLENGSRYFARGASGEVNIFRGGLIRDSSYWLRTEVPELLRNPNVQTGVVHSVP